MDYIEFNDIDDVYTELISLYDKSKEKGFELGEALYTQSAFFVDYAILLNHKMQDLIQ